jgi:itaconyl-CoA hydratase
MSYGRYFEELAVGQQFEHWPGRTINEYDDTLLSLLSMNQHPVHHDEHFARGTQHGRRLVAGPTVISAVTLATQARNQRQEVVLTLERQIVVPKGGACKQ